MLTNSLTAHFTSQGSATRWGGRTYGYIDEGNGFFVPVGNHPGTSQMNHTLPPSTFQPYYIHSAYPGGTISVHQGMSLGTLSIMRLTPCLGMGFSAAGGPYFPPNVLYDPRALHGLIPPVAGAQSWQGAHATPHPIPQLFERRGGPPRSEKGKPVCPFCWWRYFDYKHRQNLCPNVRCKNCNVIGHYAGDCTAATAASLVPIGQERQSTRKTDRN